MHGARRTVAMIALLLGAAMDMLDASLVNMALPTIARDLHTGGATLEWIVAGYTLTFAVLLLTSGRLGDRFGYRRVFIVGCLGFIVASVTCAFAPTAPLLVVFRILQGAMAALMLPQITSLLQVMYEPQERSRVLGLFGAVGGIAAALGPLAGAAILAAHLTADAWRPIFLLNLVLGSVAVAAVLLLVPRIPPVPQTRIDLQGAVLSILGFGLLVFGLVEGTNTGWTPVTLGAVMLAVPVLAAFALGQWRRRADPRSSLVPARLFVRRSFTVGIVLSVLIEAVMGGLPLVASLTLQEGLQLTPIQTALLTLPLVVGMVLGVAVLAELFLPRIGRRAIAVGAGILAVGIAGGALVIAAEGIHTVVWQLLPSLTVTGIGLGTVMGPLFAVTLADVRARDAGAASGTLEAAEQLGGALGVATIGSLFIAGLGGGLAPAYLEATGAAILIVVVIMLLVPLLPRAIRSEDEVRERLEQSPDEPEHRRARARTSPLGDEPMTRPSVEPDGK